MWDPHLQGLVVGLCFSVDFVPNKEAVEWRFLRLWFTFPPGQLEEMGNFTRFSFKMWENIIK